MFDLAGCVELSLENWLGSGESDAFRNRDNLEDIVRNEAGNLFVYAFNTFFPQSGPSIASFQELGV